MAFSVFSLQNLRKALPQWNQIACLSSSRVTSSSSKINSIYEDLGLPRPPKRPVTPFLLFLLDVNSETKVGKYSPGLHTVAADKWNNLADSEREKYAKQYQAAKMRYTDELEEYNSRLGKEQLLQIKLLTKQRRSLEKQERGFKKEKSLKDKLKSSLGKPKLPLNSYLLFVKDNAEKFNRFEVGFNERVSKAWHNLDEAERDEYKQKFRKSVEAYQDELIKWEQKMVDIGHFDLVRKTKLDLLAVGKRTGASHVAEDQE